MCKGKHSPVCELSQKAMWTVAEFSREWVRSLLESKFECSNMRSRWAVELKGVGKSAFLGTLALSLLASKTSIFPVERLRISKKIACGAQNFSDFFKSDFFKKKLRLANMISK